MKNNLGKIDPKKIRRDFPMFAGQAGKPFVFLDSAASSQTPVQVLRAMDGFYRRCRANVHRGMYAASERATEKYEAARSRVAEFIGAAPQEVIFTRGATESLNLLAHTLSRRLKAGDEVVLTVMEHHSNLVPWQQMAKKQGFSLKFIGLTPEMTLDMEEARQLITPATKVVSVTHVSNAIGTVTPVKELAALAHAQGAVIIVDAAQSAGHRPLKVSELDCDFLAFSGHKMLGPTGVGVLYGRRRLLDGLEPFLFGGDMILEVSFEDSVWNELPWKFEAGTPNIAGVIGLGAAVDYLNLLGLEAVRSHERSLTAYALEKISAIKKVTVYGPPAGADRGGVLSFVIGDIHPHDLSTILAEQGVCVRGGHHCAMPLMRYLNINGTTRASFSIYTTRQDVDTLCRAVEKAKKIFKL